MSPSIHLSLRAPGVQIQAFLDPSCLPDLISLIQNHRTDEPVPSDPFLRGRLPGRGPFLHEHSPREFRSPAPLSDAAMAVKKRLGDLPRTTLPDHLSHVTFGDKFLILIGWLEVRGPMPVKKSALRELFAQMGEPAPANPGRDIKNLVLTGLLLRTGDREGFQLTEQGWQRVGGLLPPSADGEPGATPMLA